MIIDVFKELSRDVLSLIRRAYLMDPVRYAYLYYNIIYYPEFTEVYLNVVSNEIIGYLLIYRGLQYTAVHILGNAPINVLSEMPLDNLIIHIETEPKHVNYLINELSRRGSITQSRALTMICWSNSFREFVIQDDFIIRRLLINDIKEFLRVKSIQGVRISEAEALLRLSSPHWHYYGLFINNELVSIATTYLKLPEVWAIGDVFTIPNYRNKGFAKAVVSAVTKDAINAGAMTMLHVDEDNTPAIRAYKRLGYLTIQEINLLNYNP